MFLSIVIPSYNAERFLPSLLTELSNQIHGLENEVEVIVVNDGSKDDTLKVAQEFARRYLFINIVDQENQGESCARNSGMENARGEYIYFLDSDDFIAEGAVIHFLKTIKDNPNKDLYCFSYKSTIDGKDNVLYRCKRFDKKELKQTEFLKAYLSKYIPCHICSVVINKNLIEKCLLRFSAGLRIGADIEYLLNVGSVANSIYCSDRICYIYRIRNDSIMQGYKTYSMAQYHSFEVRRDIVLGVDYQREELKNYSNFWIENQLLSNIVYYLRSDFRDAAITEKLVDDCKLLKRSIKGVRGAFKNTLAIRLAKILPVKTILRLTKRQKQGGMLKD